MAEERLTKFGGNRAEVGDRSLPIMSVIIPTYNDRERLRRLIRELAGQDGAEDVLELIIVDDGSTDDTTEIVQQEQETWSNIQLLFQTNQGPGVARNFGARSAKGQYPAFLDSDCVPNDDWFNRLVDALKAQGFPPAIHGPVRADVPAVDPFIQTLTLEGWPVATPNLVVRKDAFQQVGGFDPLLSYQFEDWDLVYRLQKVFGPLVYAPEVVIKHLSSYQSHRRSLRYLRHTVLYPYVLRKQPDLPFGPEIRGIIHRGLLRTYHITVCLLVSLTLPLWAKFLLGLGTFWTVDALRVLKKAQWLRQGYGIRVRLRDALTYTLCNWVIDYVRIGLLMKGKLLYRNTPRWQPPEGEQTEADSSCSP